MKKVLTLRIHRIQYSHGFTESTAPRELGLEQKMGHPTSHQITIRLVEFLKTNGCKETHYTLTAGGSPTYFEKRADAVSAAKKICAERGLDYTFDVRKLWPSDSRR